MPPYRVPKGMRDGIGRDLGGIWEGLGGIGGIGGIDGIGRGLGFERLEGNASANKVNKVTVPH